MFPKNVDIDCDSRLSDWELFRGFTRSMRADEFASPHPKLRRHVREETPPLVASPGSSCWPHKKDRKQTFPDVIEPYSCGASHRLRVEGFVEPEGTLMIGGATERASELVAVPCEHDSGQCFRRKSDPVCQSDPTGGRCETW
jgi:hypothetical protein